MVHYSRDFRAFTLIELAIVLMILGLITSMSLAPLSSVLESKRISSAESELDTVVELLYGYAILYDKLPCPVEGCDFTQGQLPSQALAHSGQFRIEYHVDPRFTNKIPVHSTSVDCGESKCPEPVAVVSVDVNGFLIERSVNFFILKLRTTEGNSE